METLSLEKFNPTKNELVKMADTYKDLVIKGIEDVAGYNAVDTARKELKKARVEISKTGKMLREDAIKFQKDVIAKEKEFIEIIEPVELGLKAKQEEIDIEKEKIVRKIELPERKLRLSRIGLDNIEDEFILLMDSNRFNEFYNEKHSEFLEAQQRKIQEEKEAEEEKQRKEREQLEFEKNKLAEEKRLEETRKEAERLAKEQAKKDAEEAKIKAEQEKQEAIEAERKKAEEEKQRIIKEQEEKERKAKEEAERIKREAEEEKQRMESQKKYQDFLKKNGYTEETKDDYYLMTEGSHITIFKKIDEIIIK